MATNDEQIIINVVHRHLNTIPRPEHIYVRDSEASELLRAVSNIGQFSSLGFSDNYLMDAARSALIAGHPWDVPEKIQLAGCWLRRMS